MKLNEIINLNFRRNSEKTNKLALNQEKVLFFLFPKDKANLFSIDSNLIKFLTFLM
jgi:hypothetical protein